MPSIHKLVSTETHNTALDQRDAEMLLLCLVSWKLKGEEMKISDLNNTDWFT